MPLLIRELGEGDIEPVVTLSLRAWAPVFESIEESMGSDIFRRLHPDWRVSQQGAVEAVCTSEAAEVWVGEQGGAVAGFVAVELRPETSLGEIFMLAVDPAHQGRGIGGALTSFALDWIRSAGMSVAMVETGSDPGHAPARRTYEKADFKLVPVARYFKAL
ncbi:MAG: hypothetical protein QOG64_3121 [Acidimicrobiaceae bacterium]|jgi:ribosomal protein S18 acetylase RimI-like enzyme|nr:hypothetical protein [Acidimicrobiaceae bacterium]